MKKKLDIDGTVAMLLGQPHKHVASITHHFLNCLLNHIVEHTEVELYGFGKFRLTHQRGSRARVQTMTTVKGKKIRVAVDKKYQVCFSKSQLFKQRIQKKYGKTVAWDERGTQTPADMQKENSNGQVCS